MQLKNDIAAPKMQNNFGAIKFPILHPLKGISFHLHFAIVFKGDNYGESNTDINT